jgi:hypothetical protein
VTQTTPGSVSTVVTVTATYTAVRPTTGTVTRTTTIVGP